MPVFLDDKCALTQGRAYPSGIDALVRLLLQCWRDQTAGFVSGYRGSPLGGLDRAMDPMKHANNSAPTPPRGGQRGGIEARRFSP
ncbi:MAG: hypothetical protein IPH23_10195 [Gammaproteobacteria bacterium]|nr:hypothetical protein [Gammaproteobacteria bacterium]